MRNSNQLERRTFTRFNIQIPLNLSLPKSTTKETETFKATSINVSMNGIYCTVNRYVPLFDKLLITFVSPKHDGIPALVVSRFEGIVVRVEPGQEEAGRAEYNIALFFQHLSPQQRAVLHRMITSHTAIA